MIRPISCIDEIEKVLQRLPVLAEQRHKIRKESERIYFACSMLSILDEKRHKRSGGVKKALQELADLRGALNAVHDKIQDLHAEAYDVLVEEVMHSWDSAEQIGISGTSVTVGRVPHPKVLDIDVRGMRERVEAAHQVLLANPELTRGTRRRKNAAAGVALRALYVYEALTGKVVTRITDSISHKAKGPALKLVSELFAVLDIGASPENQLRDAIKARAKRDMEKSFAEKAG